MEEERKKRLLRKVGKLLAQADGTTYAHEAESALLMAQRILCDHGMTMAEVDALSTEEQKKLVANEQLVTMGYYHNAWLLHLARVIAKAFRCKYYINHTWTAERDKHHIRLVGLSEDVAVCRDVYAYARAEGARLARLYASQPGVVEHHLYLKDDWKFFSEWTAAQKAAANREVQRIWLKGFCEGLEAKFAEQLKRSESMAVMVVVHPVVRDAYKDLGLGTSKFRPQAIRNDNGAARKSGYEAGKAFEPERPARLSAPLPRLSSPR